MSEGNVSPQKWRKKNQNQFARYVIHFCLRRPCKVRRPISAKKALPASNLNLPLNGTTFVTARYIDLPFYQFSCLYPYFLSPFLFLFLLFSLFFPFPSLFLSFFLRPFSDPGGPRLPQPPGYAPDCDKIVLVSMGSKNTITYSACK